MNPNWSKQSERLWAYFMSHPNTDIPQPELNKVAAGENGVYVNSFTKRISECRARARSLGCDLVKSRDEWHEGKRNTWYSMKIGSEKVSPNPFQKTESDSDTYSEG